MRSDNDDIARYLNNEMTGQERHLFEKRMLSDPFLAEAVEGAQSIRPEEFQEDVKSIAQQLRDQRDYAWGMTFRIAAGVVLVFVVGWLAYRGDSPGEQNQLALVKKDSTSAGPKDTLSQMLSLAQPKSSDKAPDGIASKPAKSIVGSVATADSVPPAAGSGAIIQPAPATVTEPDMTLAETQTVATEEEETATKEAAVASRYRRDVAPSSAAGEKKALYDVLDSGKASVVILEPAAARMKTSGPGLVLASPIGGIDAYRKYLENNRRVPSAALAAGTHGTAVIVFTVAADGTLTNFIRISSLGNGCEQEVERLIQAGPSWTPAKSGDSPVAAKAQVSVEF